ncbi:MAG: type II toxin-antitoxin system YoeB family toxin, partial [Pedobacter sp.]|nr:type II toxin-antitoxin system YoeB family toxin [Pedobacter sp.]
YARKRTDKHRLVFSVNDDIITVLVLAARGHYVDH